jgi:ATP-dependent Clp protease ATP-binding subunit ClpB
MDKLTSRFQSALADAQSLAVGRDNQFMEPAHVFGALLDQQDGSTRPILVKAGANVAKLRKDLDAALDRLPKVEGTPGDVHVSPNLNRLLNVTDKLAQQRKDDYISSELFVLASFEDKDTLAKLLKDAGASKAAIEKAIEQVRGGEAVNDPQAEEKRGALEKYTSTPSSVATTRSVARCRCSRAGPRTIPCSSVSRAWARPPSSKGSPSESSTAKCRKASRASAFSRSTWAR